MFCDDNNSSAYQLGKWYLFKSILQVQVRYSKNYNISEDKKKIFKIIIYEPKLFF